MTTTNLSNCAFGVLIAALAVIETAYALAIM
jgi:hypothetical protein